MAKICYWSLRLLLRINNALELKRHSYSRNLDLRLKSPSKEI